MIFLTSDQHFGHANIIKYCKRPFDSVNEMDEHIIAVFNEHVGPKDETYHLGDFTFRRHRDYLKRLNGRHYLIIGNHDNRSAANQGGFVWVKDVHMLKWNQHRIWLSHYAHWVWNRSHHGAMHAYGHSHGVLAEYSPNAHDVGVDTENFKPWTVEQFIFRCQIRTFAGTPL